MEKTKEEILTPYAYTEQWGFIDIVSLGNAKKAMQEYAEQEKEKEAIEFVSWLCNTKNIYKILELEMKESELYQIFKKEQHRK